MASRLRQKSGVLNTSSRRVAVCFLATVSSSGVGPSLANSPYIVSTTAASSCALAGSVGAVAEKKPNPGYTVAGSDEAPMLYTSCLSSRMVLVMRVVRMRAAMLRSRVSRTSRRSAPKKPLMTAAWGVSTTTDSAMLIARAGRAIVRRLASVLSPIRGRAGSAPR